MPAYLVPFSVSTLIYAPHAEPRSMPRRGAGHGKPHGEMRCKETQTIHFRFLWKADMPGMTRFPVVRIVEFCTRYPWPVLVSAAVIAAAAGFYAVDHFAITTNVSNLLSSRLPSHERETQYEKVFSDRTIVAVVTAPSWSRRRRIVSRPGLPDSAVRSAMPGSQMAARSSNATAFFVHAAR